jgi:predicted dehydrogenase
MAPPLRVGIVGCGNISGIYFQNLKAYAETEVVAVADLDLDRAKSAAERHNVPLALTTEQLVEHPDVDLVLNLTVPKAHAQVAQWAVEAGKHVYNEKPLAVKREEAKRFLQVAREKGVRVGCAPDTFLGGSHQTCRALIDEGAIGEPVAAQAFMMCHGHETWHPSPEFYYEEGGGPMMDMGPYYLTALVNMLGPIRRVTGSARITFPTRTITSQPKAGKVVAVETPTHYAGVMDFASGAVGEITQSFDIWFAKTPIIAIYGSEGSLSVPDPNGFGGEIRIRTHKTSDWEVVPSRYGHMENSRGVGVRDIALALQSGTPHRASGDLAYHVLDAMHAFREASDQGRHILLESSVERPALATG